MQSFFPLLTDEILISPQAVVSFARFLCFHPSSCHFVKQSTINKLSCTFHENVLYSIFQKYYSIRTIQYYSIITEQSHSISTVKYYSISTVHSELFHRYCTVQYYSISTVHSELFHRYCTVYSTVLLHKYFMYTQNYSIGTVQYSIIP